MRGLSNDFSDKLDAILSNPEMMAQIKRLADTMTSGTASVAEEGPEPPEKATQASFQNAREQPESKESLADMSDAVNAIATLTGGGAPDRRGRKGKNSNIAHSKALLLALKPYLDDKRCEKIDKLLKMMQLAEMAGYFM